MVLVEPAAFDAQVSRHLMKVLFRVWHTDKMPDGIAEVLHKFQILKRLDTLIRKPGVGRTPGLLVSP